MTILQIIVFFVFFGMDIILSIIKPMYDGDDLPILQTFRMIFIWSLLLFLILTNSRNMERAKGKCPEYEKVEGLYRIKDS